MSDHHSAIPVLVAHRGYAACYPENTLEACAAALQAGACFIEVDIQLTADGLPVLCHDHNLSRTTGHNALITATSSHTLRTLDAGERQRLGTDGPVVRMPSLAELVALLQRWPRAHAFIEIKEESLQVFGQQMVMQRILETLAPLQSRCIPISYDGDILGKIRALGGWQIGWVMRQYNAASLDEATALAPDYLICNYRKLDAEPLWPGPWRWVLYEVTEPGLAKKLCQRGAQMIETMAIGDLFRDTDLSAGACRDQGGS